MVGLQDVGGQVALTLKGDANTRPDPVPYLVTDVDRVLVSVPLLGYVVAWLSSKTAVFLGGIVAGVVLILAFGPTRPADEPSSVQPDDESAQQQESLHV